MTLVNPHVLQGLDLPRINKRDPREKGVDPTKIAQPNALVSKSPSTVSEDSVNSQGSVDSRWLTYELNWPQL